MTDAMTGLEETHGGPIVRLEDGGFAAADGTTLTMSSGIGVYRHPRTDAEREAMVGTYWSAVLDRANADRTALAAALAGEGPPWEFPADLWVHRLYGIHPERGDRPSADALLSRISAVAAKAQIRLGKMDRAREAAKFAKAMRELRDSGQIETVGTDSLVRHLEPATT